MAAEEAEVQVDSEDAEYDKWLSALEEDDEEVTEEEVKAEHEDDRELKRLAHRQDKIIERMTEQEAASMKDKFMAEASDTAKELFAVYCIGDENPKQLKRIMDLAKTKAAETEVDPDAVEKAAAKKAQEAYGVAPISQSGPVAEEDPWDKAREKVKAGDSHTAFQMWNSLPSSGENSVQAGD
jgi:hypothetical protein